jgi:hypothetical protein
MTRRILAALLLAASAWLWFGVAAPARRGRDAARDEFARLRAERERVRLQVEASSRRATLTLTPEKGAAAARALRRALLAAAEAAPVREVTIAASASARGKRAATGRLSAVGSLEELLVVADRLSDPASGVVIRRCVLSEVEPGGGELRLELEGATVRAGS